MKWKRKLFLFISLLFFLLFGLLTGSKNVNAQRVSSFLAIQYYYQTSPTGSWILNTVSNTGSIHNFNNSAYGGIYRVNASASLPNALTGSSFSGTGDIYFTYEHTTGIDGGFLCPNAVDVTVFPEQGTITSSQSQVKSCELVSSNTSQGLTVTSYKISVQSAGNLSASTRISSFFIRLIGTTAKPIFQYTGLSSTTVRTSLSADINFTVSTDPNTAIMGEINQNITELNQDVEDIKNFMMDDTEPSADTSQLNNSAGWLPAGPIDAILTLPINLLNGIVGVFTGTNTCQDVNVPLPYVNKNIILPCMGPILDQMGLNTIVNVVATIISFFLLWENLKWVYTKVDEMLTMREDNSGLWGGL